MAGTREWIGGGLFTVEGDAAAVTIAHEKVRAVRATMLVSEGNLLTEPQVAELADTIVDLVSAHATHWNVWARRLRDYTERTKALSEKAPAVEACKQAMARQMGTHPQQMIPITVELLLRRARTFNDLKTALLAEYAMLFQRHLDVTAAADAWELACDIAGGPARVAREKAEFEAALAAKQEQAAVRRYR